MNEKIETKTQTTPEFTPAFTNMLVIATCAVLMIIFGPSPSNRYDSQLFQKIMAPAHIVAGGITVDNGIKEFQGIELRGVPGTMKLFLLVMLLLDFVIVPACFLFAWRYAFMKKSQGSDFADGRSRLWGGRVIFILSGVTLAYICIMNTVSAIASPAVFKTMQLDNTVDQNRSFVMADLAAIDFKANQYFFLPGKKGGGDHSFRSHLDPTGKNWVTLSELGMPTETEVGTYSIKAVKNDTMLIVRGVGNARLSDGTYPEYEFYTSPTISRPKLIN